MAQGLASEGEGPASPHPCSELTAHGRAPEPTVCKEDRNSASTHSDRTLHVEHSLVWPRDLENGPTGRWHCRQRAACEPCALWLGLCGFPAETHAGRLRDRSSQTAGNVSA